MLVIVSGLTKVKNTTRAGMIGMHKMKTNMSLVTPMCKSRPMLTSITPIMTIDIQPEVKKRPNKAEIAVRPKKLGALDETHTLTAKTSLQRP